MLCCDFTSEDKRYLIEIGLVHILQLWNEKLVNTHNKKEKKEKENSVKGQNTDSSWHVKRSYD